MRCGYFFFFKQKTAYEMRISDWSSDVCSSDLGHGNIDTAVAAIRKGAVDFIEKPFEADKLLHLVSRATETDRLRRENEALRARVGQDDELTGNSRDRKSVV